ncbi:ABC-2 type transport system ATP-binding protein [Thermocatellispora tengchongensis]|uniref:ABC-2 type transport system ATP-binding protein n=1 Tax=Thermocatellispora tengchongensis TaxID=1073253 RepID=A0A840PNH4_9ACTN|nr:ABC transporter ATP-binding protein [Thermocatellispora tengchongensis]MBB5139250.1 ABC-2 type transport system ATP-binding protein [Thermocatellispora tengchongensis]
MDGPVISIQGLTKRYGEVTAVRDLDLEVRRGEVYGLLGPNGAGKTTTILTLLGLCEPTAGSVRVLGLDPAREAVAVKRQVGYVPDSVGFYPTLTGRENLRYTARLNGIRSAEDRIADALEQVGLADAADTRAGAYSRGMVQRLGIADALVKRPSVMILDEPTIAIDPEGVQRVLALIRTLRAEHGMTILLSSHLLHQVQEVCDRVGIFVRGRLVADGSVEELSRRLSGGRTVVEVGVADDAGTAAQRVAKLDGVQEVEREGDLLLAVCEQDMRGRIADALTTAGHTLLHLRQRSSHLDEIYHRYFHERTD